MHTHNLYIYHFGYLINHCDILNISVVAQIDQIKLAAVLLISQHEGWSSSET